MTSVLVRYDAACRAVAEAHTVDEVKELLDVAEAMRAYGRQAKNKQLEIDGAEIRFRATRRIGEMMKAQKETVGTAQGQRSDLGPSATQVGTLADAGIDDKHLADRARKYAALPEDQFEKILAERRERIESENRRVTVNLLEAGVRGTQGTGDNEWYTPAEYIDLARDVLGAIDLDPASSEHAQRTVKAKAHFTKDSNGLEQKWPGRVWLNPPYAQPYIEQFADKMVEEIEAHHVTAAIMLTHNYTDTAWFQKLARSAAAICFTKGRIRFEAPNGDLASPTQGQAFFYFGKDHKSFVEAFRDVGFIVRPAQ